MKLLIDISEYNAEYIKNAYGIPQDINVVIAAAIINGKQIPTPHGRLIEGDELVRIWTGAKFYGSIKPIVDARPTVIEAEGTE